ncbi:hypothetical protein ACE6H2_022960 [Prunus campanulata]
MGLGCCKEKMAGIVPMSEFKNQTPRVLQKQLDESFVRLCNGLTEELLGGLTEEKKGSNGRTWLEIEGFQR